MNKQEVIKKVYGTFLFDLYKPNSDGWIYNHPEVKQGFDAVETDGNKWRPIELSGIENNRGWEKIESFSVLPKESIECKFLLISSPDSIFVGKYNFRLEMFVSGAHQFDWTYVSHFKPLTKDDFPIF